MNIIRHILLLLAVIRGDGQPALQASPPSAREAVIAFADTALGIREATGRNDGKSIDAILATVGMAGTGAPYCAAFVVWVGDNALGKSKNPYPRSAWSPDMVRDATWTRGKGRAPQPGDTFGIFFPAKNRIAHTGLIRRNLGSVFETLEANTSGDAVSGSAADRDGSGVFKKRRLAKQVHSARDWIR